MASSLHDFLQQPPDHTPYLCFPLLPKQGCMILAAQPKTFKSMLALNIAYDLAEGNMLFNRWPVKVPCRVLVIEQEIGRNRLQERLKLIDNAKQGKRAGDNLWCESKDLDCALDSPSGLAKIEGHIKAAEPKVVIFDPFSWFHSQEENSNSAIRPVMRNLFELQRKYDFSSIIIHHMGKTSQFRDGTTPESSRGASIVYADCDTFVSVSRPQARVKEVIQCDFVLRSAEDPGPMRMEFDKVTLGFRPR